MCSSKGLPDFQDIFTLLELTRHLQSTYYAWHCARQYQMYRGLENTKQSLPYRAPTFTIFTFYLHRNVLEMPEACII